MVKKIERVVQKLDIELIEELKRFKELKSNTEINKEFIGKLSDGREYKLEVYGVFKTKLLGFNFAEIGFKFEVENSDIKAIPHSRCEGLHSMIFNPMMLIKDGEQDILVVLDLNDYRKGFHLNNRKMQTNRIVDDGFSNEYFKALILNASFNDELDLAEVLMFYISKTIKGEKFSKLEQLLKEKLAYFGFYDNLVIKTCRPLVDNNEYENEGLKEIAYIAFEMLYLNKYSSLEFNDETQETLKTLYNTFHREEVKNRFRW